MMEDEDFEWTSDGSLSASDKESSEDENGMAEASIKDFLRLDVTADEQEALDEENFTESFAIINEDDELRNRVMLLTTAQLKKELITVNQTATGKKIMLQKKLILYLRNPHDPKNPNIDKNRIKRTWYMLSLLHLMSFYTRLISLYTPLLV